GSRFNCFSTINSKVNIKRNPIKGFLFVFIAVLSMITGVVQNSFAQSNVSTSTQITLTGNASDFTTPGYTGYAAYGNGVTYSIGFDASNLYVAMFRASFSSTDNLA